VVFGHGGSDVARLYVNQALLWLYGHNGIRNTNPGTVVSSVMTIAVQFALLVLPFAIGGGYF
jgi:hypothetical protein